MKDKPYKLKLEDGTSIGLEVDRARKTANLKIQDSEGMQFDKEIPLVGIEFLIEHFQTNFDYLKTPV